MDTQVADGTLRLAVQASGEDARAASAWLEQAGGERGVPAEQLFRLDLCLNEAMANIIDHGGASARAAPVFLALAVGADGAQGHAELTISDAGLAFNPLAAAVREPAQSLAEAVPGGLGLGLMRSSSDRLGYEFRGGRNHLSFFIHWDAAAA